MKKISLKNILKKTFKNKKKPKKKTVKSRAPKLTSQFLKKSKKVNNFKIKKIKKKNEVKNKKNAQSKTEEKSENLRISKINEIKPEIKKIELKHENELESMVVNGFLDKSKEKPDKQIFQIPYEHIVVDESIDIYSINPKSNVKMHIVKDNISNNIVDIYFELDDDIEHKYIIDDIFTFLYLFN